jgi:micrococcal nuclease
MRRLIMPLALTLALVIPAAANSAASTVRLKSLTSPVSAGSHATIAVSVSRPSSCAIVVLYKSGSSHAHGLTDKRSVGGVVSWTWMVGTNTTPGRWKILVDCGKGGFLSTTFRTL